MVHYLLVKIISQIILFILEINKIPHHNVKVQIDLSKLIKWYF
jgi:hypothetical protein